MTPIEQRQYIEALKVDIAIFEAYKAEIEREQVRFPLDGASQKVIHTDLLVPTGSVVIPYNLVTYESVEVDVNGKKYFILCSDPQ